MLLLYINNKTCTTTAGNYLHEPNLHIIPRVWFLLLEPRLTGRLSTWTSLLGRDIMIWDQNLAKRLAVPVVHVHVNLVNSKLCATSFDFTIIPSSIQCHVCCSNSFISAVFSPLMIVPQGIKIHVAGVCIHIWCLILHRYLPLSNAQNVS